MKKLLSSTPKVTGNRNIYKREETDNERNKFSNYNLIQHSNKDFKIKTKRIITNWCATRSTGGERSSANVVDAVVNCRSRKVGFIGRAGSRKDRRGSKSVAARSLVVWRRGEFWAGVILDSLCSSATGMMTHASLFRPSTCKSSRVAAAETNKLSGDFLKCQE